MIEGTFIGSTEANFAGLRMKVVWAFVSCRNSMMLYWPNKCGDLC